MLRASAKQSVHNALDDSYFGASNFIVEFGNGAPTWFSIKFIPNGNFYFRVQTSSINFMPLYNVIEAPGEQLLKADTGLTKSFEESVARIPAWIQRIKEEVIDSNPMNRELQSVRKQLEDRIDSLAERQDEYFTLDEAAYLQERLGEFSERLESVSNINSELSQTVQALRTRVEELSSATGNVNKGTWFRMAGGRFLSIAKAVMTSKEGREFALDAAKKVLLEGPK